MKIKILALAASGALLAAGAAHAGDYGAPPYSAGGYAGYDGGGCEGFTIVGAHAGVTVLGINVGAGGRARIGGDCAGYSGAAYTPPLQPYPQPVYQDQGYAAQGGYYNQGGYAPVAYPQPAYPQPVYQQQAYPQPGYGYAPQPCGCAPQYGYAQPY